MGGGEILKKGWLIKSPPLESGGMKAWRKRFFCLRSSKILEYYKSVDGDLKGVVNLEDCKAVHADLSHKKYKYVFDVETKDRTYYLVASSHEEMKEWVDTICTVCAFSLQNAQPGVAGDGSSLSIGDSKTMPAKMPSGQPLITSPASTSTLTPGSSSGGISFNERFKPVQNGATSECLYSLATESGAEVKRQLQGTAGNEIPAGIPLTEALASKGLGNGASRTATLDSNFIYPMSGLSDYNFFSPRPPGVNDPQGIYSLAQQDSHPKATRSATLMPGAQLDQRENPYGGGGGHRPLQMSTSLGRGSLDPGVGRGQQGQSPSNSTGPTVSSAAAMGARTETNRAELLENGYMAPRRIPRPSGYEYPPFGPPRAAGDQSVTGSSGTPTSRQPHSALLLKPEEGKVSSPSSSAVVAGGTTGRSATYINVQSLEDNLPPPIDRTTKPTPPTIDRTLKPVGYQSPKNTPPEYEGGPLDGEDDGDSDSSDSSPETSKRGVSSGVPFSVADLPKPTNRTTQYTQVEIVSSTNRLKISSSAADDDLSKRGPIPVPREHPVPKPRRVNYSDIDLTKTAARVEARTASRSPTLRHAEQEHLKDTPYINVNREGEVDDDTDPDYYTHMRNLSEEDADRPSLEILKEFIS